MLQGYTDIDIVGECSNGKEAVGAVDQLLPAVVIMDINMPVMNGIEATARIKAHHPATIVIGLSVNANHENELAEPCYSPRKPVLTTCILRFRRRCRKWFPIAAGRFHHRLLLFE